MSYLYNCVITLEEMRCREIIYLINSGTCAKIFEKHLPAHKPAGALFGLGMHAWPNMRMA